MLSDKKNALLFTGMSHPKLAKDIASYLKMEISPARVETFPDGESSVQILKSVRGKQVFLLQTVAVHPNHYLMEMLVMIDAFKRASAESIVVVIPYFGYSRQDRKDKPRVPITAKLVANLLEKAGATRVLTMDLHANQIQGFFDIPVDNLYARPALVKALKQSGWGDCVVVSPDIGSVKLARAFATQLGVDFAFVDKRRVNSREVELSSIIGDVKGRKVLLADDICSTGTTLIKAATACMGAGASSVCVAVTHSLMVEGAIAKFEGGPIKKMFVSDSVPQCEEVLNSPLIQVVSVASLFGEAIRCVIEAESISSLFEINRFPEGDPQLARL